MISWILISSNLHGPTLYKSEALALPSAKSHYHSSSTSLRFTFSDSWGVFSVNLSRKLDPTFHQNSCTHVHVISFPALFFYTKNDSYRCRKWKFCVFFICVHRDLHVSKTPVRIKRILLSFSWPQLSYKVLRFITLELTFHRFSFYSPLSRGHCEVATRTKACWRKVDGLSSALRVILPEM